MRKFFNLIIANICIMVLFASCGKTNSDKPSQTSYTPDISSNSEIITSEENNEEPEKETTQELEEETTPNPVEEATQEPEEEKQIINATIDTQTGYSDDKYQIDVIGLKSYKKLESKLYKDKAAKNKKFLVLFLEIVNKQMDKDYINVNYLKTKIDGKEIKNSVLFNEPEGFQTIFQNIEAGGTLRGFIVWEVPKDWKEIEIVYDGWKDSNNLSLNCTFTPDDYFDPPKYS